MKNYIFKVLLSILVITYFGLDIIAQVTSVNGTTGVVQINLSLNGNNLSITGGNSINLPYSNGDISSVTVGVGLSGGGASGSIIVNANTVSAIWNANKLMGKTVSSIPPADNQILKFNGTEWIPSEDITGAGGNLLWLGNSTDIYFNSGNLSIGTSNNDAMLTVNGKIHAEELIVNLNVPAPDYIFNKDYYLMPLDKLEKYIKQNKHLPEIPSAKEFEANQINLLNMNLLILKKVEELSLYLIEHEKRIIKLENKF